MNFIKTSLILLVFILMLSVLFVFSGENTETLIKGSWQEASWKYEKLDSKFDSTDLTLQEGFKKEIYKNIVIHEAENWNFKPDGTLILSNTNTEDRQEELRWSVKGRGHILELKHKDGRVENYQIQLLTDDLLIIYFSFDIQTRGIAKITFIKN